MKFRRFILKQFVRVTRIIKTENYVLFDSMWYLRKKNKILQDSLAILFMKKMTENCITTKD